MTVLAQVVLQPSAVSRRQSFAASATLGPADSATVFAYLLYALLACALLTFTIPPFQNPDEMNHLLRADNLSRFHLLGHREAGGPDGGGEASTEIARVGGVFNVIATDAARKMNQRMYFAGAGKFDAPGEIGFPNTAVYPPAMYIPSVAAVWIGKAGRLNVVQALYLARALTALASALCIAAALYLCCRAGASGAALMIFAVATLPMALACQTACSQDGLMLGAAALSAAFLVRLRASSRTGDLIGLCVCLALVVMARPPYLALALLPLFTAQTWRAGLAGAAVVGLAGVGWTALAAILVGSPGGNPGANAAGQFPLLLDIGRDFEVLLATIRFEWWFAAHQFVGQLGWLDVTLPDWFVTTALVVLAVAFVAGMYLRGKTTPIIILAVLLSALGVLVALFLTWTAVGRPKVDGIQGRYFLPLALVLAGIGAGLPRFPVGALVRVAVLAFPIVSIGVTMRVLVVRYFLQP